MIYMKKLKQLLKRKILKITECQGLGANAEQSLSKSGKKRSEKENKIRGANVHKSGVAAIDEQVIDELL